MAWTKTGDLWIERGPGKISFLATDPDALAAQPVVVYQHDLIRLPLVEATVLATCARLLQDRSERQMIDVARGAVAFYEKLAAEAAAKGHPVLACRKSCSFCCHLKVSLSSPEALLLVEHLKVSRSADERLALRSRAAAHETALLNLAAGMPLAFRPACPLLVDNACSIYAVRPLHCRGANSKDARQCEAGGRVDAWPDPLVLANSIACGLETSLALCGLPSDMLRLSAVLSELA